MTFGDTVNSSNSISTNRDKVTKTLSQTQQEILLRRNVQKICESEQWQFRIFTHVHALLISRSREIFVQKLSDNSVTKSLVHGLIIEFDSQ